MSKQAFFIGVFGLVWLLIWSAGQPSVQAQGDKPEKVLRQLQQERLKLQQDFDRDVADGKAQTYEWESRAETIRKLAADRAKDFKVADWKGIELLSLMSLYQQAEMHAQVVEASREFLKTGSKSRTADHMRSAMIRALVSLEQVEEAQKSLDEVFKEPPDNQFELADRVGLFKELTIAWRERGRYDLVFKYARRGYDMRMVRRGFFGLDDRVSDLLSRDRLILAAEFISAQERLGFKKDAEDSHKKVLETEFNEQAVLKSFYEAELAAARLMFNPAPELVAPRWVSTEPIRLASLRGKVVLLDFWAMWCSQCQIAFPQWRELQKKFSAKGFEILGVTKLYGRSDTEESLKRDQELNALRNFKVKHQLNYPLAVGKMDDVTNDELYGIASLPTVVLIDRRGNVRHIKRGVGEYRKLEKQIEKLINE
jgi:peroxiredoxin